jgi:hypothetical protein
MFVRRARTVILLLLVIASVAALQAASFYYLFTPRIEQANALLFELGVENSQQSLYYEIAGQVRALIESAPESDTAEPALAVAWKEFAGHFTAVPRDATATLASALPELMAGNRADAGAIQKLTTRIERLQAIYADSNKELLADLREPPAYLWPMASIVAERSGYRQVAERSGYRQAVTLNRALYLAQTGEIGTARVMLAGLNASVEDPDVLATIYYMLGRLQFELFRATPEVEYYMQSIQYLRQSLVADPGLQLAQRLLDFLLSLPQAETAPQSPDGRPETPSEGEGAAISAEKRIF